MDGVIWRSYEPVIDIQALFSKITELECQAFCVTNNSTSTVDGYLERLNNFARHGTNVGPAVAPDFSFIPNAAQ